MDEQPLTLQPGTVLAPPLLGACRGVRGLYVHMLLSPIRVRNSAVFVLFSTSSLRYVCFADETSPNATVRANAESMSEWCGTGWVGKKVLGFVAALSHFGDHDIELEVGEGVPTLADRPSTFHHCQGERQCPYRLMCV